MYCRNPGLNQGPLDLQSNALPTELFRPHTFLFGRVLGDIHRIKKLLPLVIDVSSRYISYVHGEINDTNVFCHILDTQPLL